MIRSQGPFRISCSESMDKCSNLYVSYLDVCTGDAVNTCMICSQGSFGISDSDIIILASIVKPGDLNGGEIIIIAAIIELKGLNGSKNHELY